MTIRRCVSIALLLAAAALRLPAQSPAPKLDCNRALMVIGGLTTSCEMREFAFDAEDSLLVAVAGSGGVSVYPWDGGQVLVRAQVLGAAGSEWAAAAFAAKVQVAAGAGEIRVTGPSTDSRQSWSASLEIYVPAATALRLSAINGSISVHGAAGDITASAVNGAISITGATGNITANGVNGKISISVPAP